MNLITFGRILVLAVLLLLGVTLGRLVLDIYRHIQPVAHVEP